MAVDHIRYDILAQDALRGVVRKVLTDAAKKGLPGEHHFFVTFDTRAAGVRLSARMREQYPEEMTIVLQHQFWDLKVTEQHLEVGLSFGGVAERLVVPFDSIKSFFDPSIQFGLQFETIDESSDETAGAAKVKDDAASDKRSENLKTKPRLPTRHEPAPTSVPAAPVALPAQAAPVAEAKGAPEKDAQDKPSGEVVRLDRFRKK